LGTKEERQREWVLTAERMKHSGRCTGSGVQPKASVADHADVPLTSLTRIQKGGQRRPDPNAEVLLKKRDEPRLHN
jgi:hypothetical protein